MADKVEKKVIKSTFLLRRGDESEWQGKTLNEGEPGFAKDNGILKVGQKENGQLMKWEDLPAMMTKEGTDNTYLPLSGGTLTGSLDLGNNLLLSTSGINIAPLRQFLGINTTGIAITHGAIGRIAMNAPEIRISTTNGTTINGSLKLNDSLIDMNSHKITNLIDPTSTQDAATKNYVDNKFIPKTGTKEISGTTTITSGSIKLNSGILYMGTGPSTSGAAGQIRNVSDPTANTDAATKGYTDTTIKSSLDSLRTWLTADNMDNILPWPYYAMTTTKTSTSAGGNPCEINGMTYNVDETGWVHVIGGQLTNWVNYYFATDFKFIPGLYNLSWVCVNYDDGIGTTKRSIVAPFIYVAPSSGYVFTPINGVHTLVKQEDVPSGATTSPTVSAIGNGSKIRINNEINLNIYQQYGYVGSLPVSSGKFKLKLQRIFE